MRAGPPSVTKKELLEKVLALLQENQRQEWRKLTGAPFAGLDEPQFPWMHGSGPPRDPARENKAERAERP
jgi:hypothetical protein